MRRTDEEILKQVLYQGLSKDLKQVSIYLCNTSIDYDKFKVELWKIEAELREDTADRGQGVCKPAMKIEPTERSELSQVKDLFKKLN